MTMKVLLVLLLFVCVAIIPARSTSIEERSVTFDYHGDDSPFKEVDEGDVTAPNSDSTEEKQKQKRPDIAVENGPDGVYRLTLKGESPSGETLQLNSTAEDVFNFLIADYDQSDLPANVSSIFKGRWNVMGSQKSISDDMQAKPFARMSFPFKSILGTLPYSASSGTTPSSSGHFSTQNVLGISKNRGDIVMRFFDVPTVGNWGNIVYGDAILRDGIYSTDHNVGFLLHGFFYKPSGIFIVAAFTHSTTEHLALDKAKIIEAARNESSVRILAEELIYALNGPIVIDDQQQLGGCSFVLFAKASISNKSDGVDGVEVDPISSGSASSSFAPSWAEPDEPLVKIDGILSSRVCGLVYDINLETIPYDVLFSKITVYLAFVSLVSFIQAYVVLKQLAYSSSSSVAARSSMLTIVIQATMDSYLCLAHLVLGVSMEPIFNSAATASLLEFVVFSVFEMRLLIMVWKAQRPDSFNEGWEQTRRELGNLYARFYLGLLVGLFIIYQIGWKYLPLFTLLLMFFWVPQIVMNAVKGSNKPFHRGYVLGVSLTRLFIPLYFTAYSANFLHLEPQPFIATLMILFVFIQVCLLYMQDRFGPRFFIPARFLPPKYDYHRNIPSRLLSEYPGAVSSEERERERERDAEVEVIGSINGSHSHSHSTENLNLNGNVSGSRERDIELGELHTHSLPLPSTHGVGGEGEGVLHIDIDCTICMSHVDIRPENREAYMLTPCDHLFHSQCLLRWMDIKMECPTCRAALELP